jgi:hypothetical protein
MGRTGRLAATIVAASVLLTGVAHAQESTPVAVPPGSIDESEVIYGDDFYTSDVVADDYIVVALPATGVGTTAD